MAAEIIPFPARPNVAAPPCADERLARALRGLEAALAEQRQAVANWRVALAGLQESVRGVGEGLQRYRGSLDRLQADVSALNGHAVRLAQWADSVLADE